MAAKVYYTLNGNEVSVPMTAADGTFDSPREEVAAVVDISSWTDGHTYRIYVQGKDIGGNWGPSTYTDVFVSDFTPPTFSGLITAKDTGVGGKVNLTWTAAEDVSTPITYTIYYAVGANAFAGQKIEGITVTCYEVCGLENGREYSFAVRAVDAYGNEDENTVQVSATPTDRTPPSFDGILSVKDTGLGGIVNVTWTEGSDESTITYTIYYGTGYAFSGSKITGITGTYYLVEGLENGKEYKFAVRAVDAYSNEDGNTVQLSAVPTDRTPPVFSGIASAENTGIGNSVLVTWEEAFDYSPPVTYTLYYGVGSAFGGTRIEGITSTSYLLEGLTNNVEYSFAVRAIDVYGNEDGNVVQSYAIPQDTTPPTFAGLSKAEDTENGGEVRLTWSEASDHSGNVTYTVYWGTESAFDGSQIAGVEGTTYTLNGLENGKEYRFAVRAVDAYGNEDENTVQVSATPTDHTPPVFGGLSTIADKGDGRNITLIYGVAEDNSPPVTYLIYESMSSSKQSVFITISDTFSPTHLELPLGTTVVWKNADIRPHTIKFSDWTSPTLPPGRTYSYTFLYSGLYRFCDADEPSIGGSVRIYDANYTTQYHMFNITLPDNTTRYYIVRAVDAYGNEDENLIEVSITPQDITPPFFEGVSAAVDVGTGGAVELSWSVAHDLSGPVTYNVYYGKDSAFGENCIEGIVGTNYTVSGLSNGVEYRFAVRARDAYGNEEENSKVLKATPHDCTAPTFGGIKDVKDTGIGGEVLVTWDAAEDRTYVTYLLYYGRGDAFEGTNISGITGTSYLLEGLENYKEYRFAVRARDAYGNEDENTVQISAVPTDRTPPTFSGIDRAENTGRGGEVRIIWPAAKDRSPPISYNVYVSTQRGIFGAPTVTTYDVQITLSDLSNGVYYYFMVRAVDAYGNEDNNTKYLRLSPQDTTPPTFYGLKDAQDTGRGGAVVLSWVAGHDPGGGEITYNIYRGEGREMPTTPTYSGITDTEYIDQGLVNGVKYYYLVRAVDAYGNEDGNEVVLSAIPTRPNTAPVLTSPDYRPKNTTTEESFTFTIVYSDKDGDAPAYVRLFLDSIPYEMMPTGTLNYEKGVVYSYGPLALKEGEHLYRFEAQDDASSNRATSGEGKLVTTSTYQIIITAPASAPILTNAMVKLVGAGEYKFSVLYTDEDGDAPRYMKLVIDEKTYNMNRESADYRNGARYSVRLKLDAGEHTYYFSTSDGVYDVKTDEKTYIVPCPPSQRNPVVELFTREYNGISGTYWFLIFILFMALIWVVKGTRKGPITRCPYCGGSMKLPRGAEEVLCPYCRAHLRLRG